MEGDTNWRGRGGTRGNSSKRKRGRSSESSRSTRVPPPPSQPTRAPPPPSQPPSEAILVAPPPQHEWDDSLGVRMETTNKRSKLWANWIQFTDHEGVIKAKCVFCGAILKADSSKICNSSHACKKRNEVLAGQLRLNFQQGSGLGTSDWTYCLKRLKLKIARMIIKDELLFIFVEKEGFVEMMQEASPSFKMSCRKSIRADCLKLFIEGKEELKSFFYGKVWWKGIYHDRLLDICSKLQLHLHYSSLCGDKLEVTQEDNQLSAHL
ncbi:hypothetical protein LINPERHAP2_LOCUS34943 [Linum perenne]